MKNNQDKEFKRWLKNKLSVTQALMIHFLITGSLSMFGLAAISLSSNVAYGALNDNGTGSTTSVAIGEGSVGNGDRSIAIGKNATTNNYESIAIGNDSKTTSNNNIAIGKGARSEGNNNSLALGNGAIATGNDGALAIGRNSKADGYNAIAVGREAETSAGETIALGFKAKAKNTNAVAIGNGAVSNADNAVAIGIGSKVGGNNGIALGKEAEATLNDAIALGHKAKAQNIYSYAIGTESMASAPRSISIGYKSVASHNNSLALGWASKASGATSVALGAGSTAQGNDSYAIGMSSVASAETAMAFGNKSKAKKHSDIALGREAETRDQGSNGYNIAIGVGAVSGSDRAGLSRNGNDGGSIAIGTGAYTGVKQNNISSNSSVALGAGAGTGFRKLDVNGMPTDNGTDVDTNVEVLKKAFGVKDVNTDFQRIAGGTNGYTNVEINEGIALGRNARAVGDQSVAIGAQTIAGMGAVALGGNDITQFAKKKYYKSTRENFAVTETIDHNQDATISDRTISDTYKYLVGTALDTAFKATYAQDGSVVLGLQAHSGTPLGTAIGTNALIRKGAFGATAIGAGSQIQANAEAAVAIGMGSRANGSYAIAAGTASFAELGDVAIGYQSEASGKEGAISIGQATKAKGDSSIMIGGANVVSASNQQTSFISEKQDSNGVRDTYTKDITETINNQQVIRRYSYVTLEDKTGTIADAYATLTGTTMNIQKLDYNQNKNGHASTSVGVHSLAKGDLASAFGASSRANAIGSLALGTGAQALVQNSVAIGTGSIAGDANYQDAGYNVTTSDPVIMGTRQLSVSYNKDGKIVSDADIANIAYTFKWAGGENTSPGDIVSFGKKGAERQLKHVAAGRIAENSTDAVNGSQLNAIIERFVGDKIKYFSVKSDAQGNRYNDGATGTGSIAIGPAATATATNATATGNKSKASAENATAYGYNTEATGKSSVALGTSAIKPGTTTLVTTEASGENSTALGVASKAKGQDSIALGYGVEAKNNFATAIGSEATVTADKGIAIGKKASVTVAGGIALGTDSVASVEGTKTGISVDGDVDGARTNVYENLKNNIDNSKISGANGAVSVGSSTATRQIVNLAAGTDDTDAVNVAQLKSVNLAFKGNTGIGDVRLHDQRLAVVSSNTDLLTVEASDKKLTFTPKIATLNIDNTTGSATLGKVVTPTTDGLVKASELANTLNNMYWNVATGATSGTHTGNTDPQPIKAGETVKFIAGEHVTIGQNGRDITISMKDALTQVQLNKAIQQTFGNGKNTTLTIEKNGTMKYSLNDDISLNTVTTGTTVVSNGKVTGLNNNLTNTENKVYPGTNKSEPVKKAELPNTSTVVDKKNAATVGDVLNAGWNLQNNGTEKDFVRTYDTVNFVDGINTKAVVTTDEEGKVSKVRYNVVGLPIKYTDDSGNPVTKVGDKYYKTDEAGNVLDNDGNPVTKYDTAGNPLNANNTAVTPVNDVKTNLVNAKPETGKTGTTDPTTLGNIKSGLDTIKNPDGTTTPNLANKTAGLVNLNTPNVSDNNAATVGDLKNMGWVVSAEGNSYSNQVRNANEVNFVGKNGLTVTGKTEVNGVRTITIENSHSPITYTDENGNKLRKIGDNFYPENAVVYNGNVYPEGSVVIDGDVYPAGTTKLANGNKVKENGDPAVVATPIANTSSDKVKATLNSVTANKPTTLSNVGSNLKQVVDPNGTNSGGVKNPDGTDVIENGAPVTVTNKAPYTASEAADIVKNSGNNAATVGDVLNAGWNLQNNSEARDFVKPYDTVNFINGGNTTAVVTTDENGTTSNVTYNVTGLPVTYTNEDGKPVSKVGNNYYVVNDKGQPLQNDGITPVTKYDSNGNPLNDDDSSVTKVDTTTKPLKTNLVNPNVATDKQTTTPIQLGNVKSGLDKITGAGNKAAGLVNLDEKDTTNKLKVSDNNVATVGDLRNMGWVVSSDKTTGNLGKAYNDKVRNANEVKFVGTGTAIVSGKTVNGVRTITVEVNDQLSTNNSVTAVVYTKADGTKVYPVKKDDGSIEYHTTPDGKGTGDTVVPKNEVITSVNGPDGTKNPTTLKNIAGNLEGAKKDTTSPKINATAPTNIDDIKNNAATVGDVLNAGWNLQGNGKAVDFVKPYDTVNFVDGMNTRAVVTTDAEGKVSNVQIDVKDLPIAYTNEAGDKVVKAADGKYYKESDLAGKVFDPTTKTFKNADGTAATQPTEVAKDAIKTNLVNPNAATDKTGTTDPSTLGNVKSGLDTIKDATGGTTPSITNKTAGLLNLTNDKVSDNNAVTVGDLRKMGWVVSSDKTTDGTGEYSDQVKNANEVRFVGKGTATVSGKTDGDVRTITVEVNDQLSTNNSVIPVVYTKADGTQVYPIKQADGTTKFNTKADGTGEEVDKGDVITSVNGPDGTKNPTTLKNIAGNLEGAKKDTTSPKINATAPNNVDAIKNNAATVGDVLNAGWNLQNNGEARDFVKPYDTVNFVDGMNTRAVVTTDAEGKVSNVQIDVKDLPIAYTNEAGDKVVKAADGKYYKESDLAGKVFDPTTKTFKNADGTAATQPTEVAKDAIKTNLVNPNAATDKTGTTDPSTLGNVKSGLDKITGANNKAAGLVNLINDKVSDNNAATVGDLRNMGWVVSSDKTTGNLGTEYNDQVRNANEVKFVGKNGIQVSGKTDDKGVRTLTFEMETGEITPTEIVKPDDNKLDKKVVTIGNKVYNAEDIDTNGKPKAGKDPIGTIVDGKVYADKDLNADGKPKDSASPIAKVKENVGAKFVTGNQVADAIEKSGFIVGKNQGLRESDFENKDEKINPNDELRFADGRNTNVKLATKDVIDATGKVKTVTTVKVDVVDLPITYTDESGKVVVKGKDGKFYYPEALDGKVYDEKEKTYKNPDGSALDKQPEAKENIQANLVNPNVSNTDTEPNKQTTTPTQLGNIANGANTFAKVEGKQIANDGKWYNEGDVLPNGKPKENATSVEKPENVGKSGLIDFEKSKPNNAATVGDLQNLGWVVSADKTTGDTSKAYNDQVRNSNEVKFVGKNGIQVSGKTDDNGVRTLTFEMETGEITPTEIIKADGTKLVKVGNKAYNLADIGTNGQPKDGAKPAGIIAKDGKVYNVTDVDDKGNVITQTGKPAPTPIATNKPNNGTKFVTGNQVADALEKSGFVVGKSEKELSAADFKNEDEKLNPNDELRFADGKNTNVKLATKEVIDASGKVKTVTTVKVDVEELPITYTDKAGNPIVKKGDKFYLVDKNGNATKDEVKVEDVKTNLVAPNSKPNEIGTPQSLGNVASGLKAADIKTDANKSDDKKVVEGLIGTEDDKKLNTAVNLDDLKTLSKAGLDFGANVGDDVHRNLGTKLSILGNDKVSKEDANNETKFSSKNVVTTTGKDSVNIKFSQNPEFDSIKIGNRENKPVVTISSEGIDAGNTKITNVAPGEISNTSQDAINGSQLNNAIKGLNAGIASSVAMANLPQVSNIGMHRHNIAASVGVHRGETAIALGLSGLNHRGSLVYKASGALNTKGHVSFGIGIGYQFDKNTRDNDTHRNDIIDLKEKLEDVIRENAEYKQEIQEYRKEQEQNKAIIEQLMKRLEALEKTK
ncbi:YadA-like family protein [Pseudostreptobacillus hongkongensis]|uniref:YadA-like family protein n=2 Tax=Pseudostreptobacillus hongkongensis TaxID=1162717 RepID=UPI000835F6D9|nr:YadA-like family protein [Pseudostreptobacillus hongkongensis]